MPRAKGALCFWIQTHDLIVEHRPIISNVGLSDESPTDHTQVTSVSGIAKFGISDRVLLKSHDELKSRSKTGPPAFRVKLAVVFERTNNFPDVPDFSSKSPLAVPACTVHYDQI